MKPMCFITSKLREPARWNHRRYFIYAQLRKAKRIKIAEVYNPILAALIAAKFEIKGYK